MRKVTFLKGLEIFNDRLVKTLIGKKFQREHVQDAVNEMIVSHLEKKVYIKFTGDVVDNKLFVYLRQSAQWFMLDATRKASLEQSLFTNIDETEQEANSKAQKLDRDNSLEQFVECPFCHVGILNEFGACKVCHTILGVGKPVRRTRFSIEEADLASMPEIDLSVDVRRALDTLTPLERKVIDHCAIGNDTLDDLAMLTYTSRQTLWRTYVKAKRKLQAQLFEYA